MRSRSRPLRPVLDALEGRLALSAAAFHGATPTAPAEVAPRPPLVAGARRPVAPPGAPGRSTFTLADLKAFSAAYLGTAGGPRYNPAYDFNRNGFIGHDDAKFLVRRQQRLTPNMPLRVQIHLAPGQQVAHPSVHNSGGITRRTEVKVVGRTTPGSLVLTDNSAGTYAFNGQALPTDARGNFSYTLRLKEDLTNTEYLIFDPFGHQLIRAFPILRVRG